MMKVAFVIGFIGIIAAITVGMLGAAGHLGWALAVGTLVSSGTIAFAYWRLREATHKPLPLVREIVKSIREHQRRVVNIESQLESISISIERLQDAQVEQRARLEDTRSWVRVGYRDSERWVQRVGRQVRAVAALVEESRGRVMDLQDAQVEQRARLEDTRSWVRVGYRDSERWISRSDRHMLENLKPQERAVSALSAQMRALRKEHEALQKQLEGHRDLLNLLVVRESLDD